MKPKWHEIRLQLEIRSLGRCERCGTPLQYDWETQHRRARGMGGTRRPDVHNLANLLALCVFCHDLVERHERQAAFDTGVALRQRDDPLTAPVLLHGRRWVLLTADGQYTDLTGVGEATVKARVNGPLGEQGGVLQGAPPALGGDAA